MIEKGLRLVLALAFILTLIQRKCLGQENGDQIKYIRKVFQETTTRCESISPKYLRLDTLRDDGAIELRQWMHNDKDIKFQLTEYDGKDKRVSDFYFGNGGLIFAFTRDFRHDELDHPYVRENRYYFKNDDTLIRWLDEDKNEVDPTSEGFLERGYEIWADMHSSGETFFMYSGRIEVSSEKDKHVITPEGIYGITFDRPVSDFFGELKKGILNTGEGDFKVYYIRTKKGEEVGHLFVDESDQSIKTIEITSSTVSTNDGVAIGTSYKKFSEIFPEAEVRRSEIENRLFTKRGKFIFLFDGYSLNVPGKVKSIIIQR